MIIETDLGNDPDDLLAILYLVGIGVNIDLIILSPGSPDQIALADQIRIALGLKFDICVNKGIDKNIVGGVHTKLFNLDYKAYVDGNAQDLIAKHDNENQEVLIIGPCHSIETYLENNTPKFKKVTFQGGFFPYSMLSWACKGRAWDNLSEEELGLGFKLVENFKGKFSIPTFNLNGSKNKAKSIMEFGVSFIGKNICHAIVYTEDKIDKFNAKNPASFLFVKALEHLKGDKKLHDLVAVMAHLNPSIAKWASGRPIYANGGWSNSYQLLDKNRTAFDFNETQFWENLYNFKEVGKANL